MQTRVERRPGFFRRSFVRVGAAWRKKPSLLKRMLFTLLAVLALIAAIAGIKWWTISRMMANRPAPPAPTVTTTKATLEPWQPVQASVGTVRAVRGADLAFDVAGVVSKVNLVSGDDVKQGQVLVQLRDDDDVAVQRQAEAAAALARVTFDRAKRQLDVKAISQADYDNAAADLKAKQAAVQQAAAVVAKKQLRAPFDGRAGIVTLSPGAYVNAGSAVVTVQQLDPVFVDFSVPQRDLGRLKVGQRVVLRLDAYADRTFEGKLSAIDPKVDGDTRNARVEASAGNADGALVPGMFANIGIDVGEQSRQLTLPQTAITFNPYGETVYVVKAPAAGAKDEQGQPAKPTAQQVFVTTGATRGDQIVVLTGIEEGTEVVTSGQLKLKNGSALTIDNSRPPKNDAAPTLQEQ